MTHSAQFAAASLALMPTNMAFQMMPKRSSIAIMKDAKKKTCSEIGKQNEEKIASQLLVEENVRQKELERLKQELEVEQQKLERFKQLRQQNLEEFKQKLELRPKAKIFDSNEERKKEVKELKNRKMVIQQNPNQQFQKKLDDFFRGRSDKKVSKAFEAFCEKEKLEEGSMTKEQQGAFKKTWFQNEVDIYFRNEKHKRAVLFARRDGSFKNYETGLPELERAVLHGFRWSHCIQGKPWIFSEEQKQMFHDTLNSPARQATERIKELVAVGLCWDYQCVCPFWYCSEIPGALREQKEYKLEDLSKEATLLWGAYCYLWVTFLITAVLLLGFMRSDETPFLFYDHASRGDMTAWIALIGYVLMGLVGLFVLCLNFCLSYCCNQAEA